MLKVIVVDDEMLIRKRIIYGFDWSAMGYEIEDEAENGLEALKLMEEKKYDVAIVDIAMPGMNGIELSTEIKKREYELEVIILTGHSDFSYARQSLQNGVFDYILKPIHEEEFTDSLIRLHHKIREEKRKKNLLGQLDTVLQAKSFHNFFLDISKEEDVAVIHQTLSRAGISENQPFILLLLRAEAFVNEGVDKIERLEILNKVKKAVFADWNCLILSDIYEENMAMIFACREYISLEAFLQYVKEFNRLLQEETGAAVLSGISLIHREVSGLGLAYREAFSAINNAMVLERQILAYSEVKRRKKVYYKIAYEDLIDFQYSMGSNDFTKCRKIIQKIFHEMKDKKISFEGILHNVNRLFMELMDSGVISEQDIHCFFQGYRGIEQVLSNMDNMEEMSQWCENIIYHLMEQEIRTSMEKKSLDIVEKACRYIREHYHDTELNQVEIADALSVTASYISGVFKKAMGVTMIQYITMVRMEKARELLLEQPLSVKAVAEKTGYHDEYYFSRCFKKQYGFSPMQIRKISDSRRVLKIY